MVKSMSEDLKHTPEILSAKDLQDMGFSRSMSYALFNREDIPVIRIGKRKFIRREKFMEWLAELYAKRDKLIKRQAAVKEQEKLLDKRIAALNEKIKEIERTRLLNMCKERNWTLSDLMDVLESIPEGMDFKTFTKKVNKKSQQTKKEEHDDQI